MLTNPLSSAETRRMTVRDRILLTVLSLVVLLPGTFGVSLVDRDEGWYAQVSREMLDSGDWLVPHYLGEPWIAKPPLLYWCVASSYAIFGIHVWAARLVPVLATVGVVHLLATLTAGLYSRRAAWIASVSFITAGLPIVIGKMLLTDGPLLLCCMGAMLLLWQNAARGVTVARSVGFWICVGLAILAKGPAVIVFVGAFALALLTQPNPRRWLFSARLWLTSPICLAVAAPWYIYVAIHTGGTLVQQFFWYEVFSRLAGTPHGHGGPPGYFVLLSLAGWLPWTILVPGALIETWQSRRRDRVAWLLLIWCGLPWLLLELIPSKLPHYILPCYLPMAIMLGRMWDIGLRQAATRGQAIVLYIWAAVPLTLGIGLLAAGVHWHSLTWSLAAGVAGAVLLVGFALVAWFIKKRRLPMAWAGAAYTVVLFHILLGLWLLPGFEPYRLSRNIAEQINEITTPDTQILISGYEEPSLFFYLNAPAQRVPPKELADHIHKLNDHARSCDTQENGRAKLPLSQARQEPRPPAQRRRIADGDLEEPAVLAIRAQALQTAGLSALADNPNWHHIVGFNYVKWREETVWIGRVVVTLLDDD